VPYSARNGHVATPEPQESVQASLPRNSLRMCPVPVTSHPPVANPPARDSPLQMRSVSYQIQLPVPIMRRLAPARYDGL
jgi:hypothetical protein